MSSGHHPAYTEKSEKTQPYGCKSLPNISLFIFIRLPAGSRPDAKGQNIKRNRRLDCGFQKHHTGRKMLKIHTKIYFVELCNANIRTKYAFVKVPKPNYFQNRRNQAGIAKDFFEDFGNICNSQDS